MTAISLDLQLHLERSHCINAFVEVEKALMAVSVKLTAGSENELQAQRIKRLKDVPASPSFSKEQRKQLHAALNDVELLGAVRNDIVHGAMAVLTDGTKPLAAFTNVRQVDSFAPVARLLTTGQLRDISERAQALAARLEALLLKPRAQTLA